MYTQPVCHPLYVDTSISICDLILFVRAVARLKAWLATAREFELGRDLGVEVSQRLDTPLGCRNQEVTKHSSRSSTRHNLSHFRYLSPFLTWFVMVSMLRNLDEQRWGEHAKLASATGLYHAKLQPSSPAFSSLHQLVPRHIY
jgi:hypothetical protein